MKVEFQVLCLQVGGSRKIVEVQVRVKFVLADAVFFLKGLVHNNAHV